MHVPVGERKRVLFRQDVQVVGDLQVWQGGGHFMQEFSRGEEV